MSRLLHASYLNLLFDRNKLDRYLTDISNAFEWFEREHEPIDCLAVSGVSGVAVGSVVAHHCNKRLIVVRKADDASTHSWHRVEGLKIVDKCDADEGKEIPRNNYVFFDDLIDTGCTLGYTVAMIRAVAKDFGNSSVYKQKFIGVVTYGRNQWPVARARRQQVDWQFKANYHNGSTTVKKIHEALTRRDQYSPMDGQLEDYYQSLLPTSYTLIGD